MNKENSLASRRKFMKGLGGGAILAAATGTGYSVPGMAAEWSSEFDWICVGSGVAGCASAIAGHDKGMKTLLLEQSDMIGGTSAQASSTGAFAPVNQWQRAAGIHDTREKAVGYLRYVSGGYALQGHMEAYVDHAARMLDYIHEKEGIEFTIGTPPARGFYDPFAAEVGMPGRRVVVSKPFPAETLGPWRDKVRLSLWYRGFTAALKDPRYPLIGGNEGAAGSVEKDGPASTVERELAAWKKRLGPEKYDALVRRNEEQRVGGAGWIAYLFRAVLKRGIDVRLETNAEKLLVENGRIVGVVVNQRGKRENIRANKGILLALGNSWLGMEVGWGPGWMLAAEVGAKIQSEPFPISMVTIHVPGEAFPNGKAVGRTNYERFMQHSFIVNRFGDRFDNEAFYSGVGRRTNYFDDPEQHRFRNFPNYFIFDRRLLEKYAFGGMPPDNTDNLDWVTQANSISELAAKLKIAAPGLAATVARFNEFTARGKDLDFNRDPKTMGPVEKPPFYGVETSTPDPFKTVTTVVTNPHAQVLHYMDEKPIPGLYCAGALCTTSNIWGMGYQGGLELGGGATFGFLAAEHAATE